MRSLLALLLLTATALSQTTGQWRLSKRNANGTYTDYGLTAANGQAIGFSAGLPAMLPITASSAWADITGKPSTFPPEAHTQAISTITGLQTALDATQPLNSTLSAIASLNHSAGVLTDNGSGTLSYTATSTGGFGAADDGKLTTYSSDGSLFASFVRASNDSAWLTQTRLEPTRLVIQDGLSTLNIERGGTGTCTLKNGTVITTADTGTVTNAMLANSSITINGTAVSLGGSTTISGGLTIGTSAITGGTSGRLLTSGTTVGELTLGAGVSSYLTSGQFDGVTITNSLTGSASTPGISITGTWNTSGAASAIKANITNTASAPASTLIDLQVAGTSRVNYNIADGFLKVRCADTYAEFGGLSGGSMIWRLYGSENMRLVAGAALTLGSSNYYAINSDTIWRRSSAAVWQAGLNHATTTTNQTIKAHDVTTGTGAALDLRGGNGSVAGGAVTISTSTTTTPTVRITVKESGVVNMSSTPTSSAGLSSGDIWRDDAAGGVLKQVP